MITRYWYSPVDNSNCDHPAFLNIAEVFKGIEVAGEFFCPLLIIEIKEKILHST
jgi:hypothetical protein